MCSRSCVKIFGWNTASANSGLLILEACFGVFLLQEDPTEGRGKIHGFGPTLAAEQLDKTRSEGWLWADHCSYSAPPPHPTTYSDRSMKPDCIPPRPDSP